ncbi:uncharacterized protein [Aquarana catesbeiana]|uniref:uncharacterized protein isoform X2 n=1 Tax=Aquarana catesbeiana TaxID=8400 RepID=UPI003CC9CB6B
MCQCQCHVFNDVTDFNKFKRGAEKYRQPPTELKSAISTMKVILLFALFGLSFGSDGDVGDGTKCPVNPNAEVHNCLIQALLEFGYLFPAIGNYVCAYNKLKEDPNVDNYNVAAQEFIKFLRLTNCQFDNYLDKGQTLKNLLVPIGGTGIEALKVGRTILKAVGIDELKMKLICLLARGLLQSNCMKKAIENIADILTDLDDLYCKLKNRGPTDTDEDAAAAPAAAGETAIFLKNRRSKRQNFTTSEIAVILASVKELGCILVDEFGQKVTELVHFGLQT